MTDIASPCRNICQLDPRGEACLGCGRTRDEIGAWMAMSADERAAVMTRLARAREQQAED